MKYILIFFLLFFLNGCTCIKFKEMEGDYTQKRKGKITQINVTEIWYDSKYADSLLGMREVVMRFNKQNNVVSQKEVSSKDTSSTLFHYNDKNLLAIIAFPINFGTDFFTYKYDDKNNLIEQKSTVNDTVQTIKSFEYDKCNNQIKNTLHNFIRPNGSFYTIFNNNYKNNSSSVRTFDLDANEKPFSLIVLKHNRKGEIISIQSSSSIGTSELIFEYDKKGNLTKKTLYNPDRTIRFTLTASNIYDKHGNIISREHRRDGNLDGKWLYKIMYK